MLTARLRHHTPSHRTRHPAAPWSTTHPRRAGCLYGRFTRTVLHANGILRAGRVRTRSSAWLFRFLFQPFPFFESSPILSIHSLSPPWYTPPLYLNLPLFIHLYHSRVSTSLTISVPYIHFLRSPFAGAPIPFETIPLAFFPPRNLFLSTRLDLRLRRFPFSVTL
ncbi:hypothetical protein B0H14DRAFT_2856716 [Mycena olivaceomarginata]|nr:hypothetical protein B0H14DRAFT_2856716 [Mycena olivaceomarginata]